MNIEKKIFLGGISLKYKIWVDFVEVQIMNSINPSVEEVVITEEPRKSSDVVKNETAAIGLEELKV